MPSLLRTQLTERTSSLSLSEESGIYWWYGLLCLTWWTANSAWWVAKLGAFSVTVTVWWLKLVIWAEFKRELLLWWLNLGTEFEWLFIWLVDVAWVAAFAPCSTTSCFTQLPTLSVAEFCTTFCIFRQKEALETWTAAVKHQIGAELLLQKRFFLWTLRITRHLTDLIHGGHVYTTLEPMATRRPDVPTASSNGHELIYSPPTLLSPTSICPPLQNHWLF